jgi:riboflavin synthase
MFTGLIDDIGTIDGIETAPAGREIRIACGYADLAPGESIAVQGACLTVRDCGPGWFTAAAIATTLARTTMGHWSVGQRVNLERPLAVGARLGGHIVLGHVDGVGTVLATATEGDAWLIDIAVPDAIAELLVPHGSVTVDGVSLTVNALPSPAVLQVALIEYTRRHTTLGAVRAGDGVHLEADVIGKYVRQLVAPYLVGAGPTA